MTATLPSSLSIGNILAYNNGKYRILKMSHVKPGKGGAFYQIEMKEIKTGTKLHERIRSEDKLDRLETSTKDFKFLYRSGNDITIMEEETYEQIEVPVDMLAGFEMFLDEDMKLMAEYVGEELVNIKLPQKLFGVVGETDPVLKNAAINPSYKHAVLENGYVVDIPPYIEQGTKVIINSETGEFIEKAK
jgi:elongation factor P